MSFFKFFKDEVKTEDKCTHFDNPDKELDTPEWADKATNIAFKNCTEVAKGLTRNDIAAAPFFFLFYIDLMINYVFEGRTKMILHYLDIFKVIKEKRKKHARDIILARFKKTKERERMLDALDKI